MECDYNQSVYDEHEVYADGYAYNFSEGNELENKNDGGNLGDFSYSNKININEWHEDEPKSTSHKEASSVSSAHQQGKKICIRLPKEDIARCLKIVDEVEREYANNPQLKRAPNDKGLSEACRRINTLFAHHQITPKHIRNWLKSKHSLDN